MRGKNNIVPLPGFNTSDATATADKILSSYTAYGGNGKITGIMPDNGETNHTLPINGSYTIPKGYHNGSGRISQSITTKSAETYIPTTSNQTITAGRYLNGDQIIKGDGNLVAGNIKKGISIFGVVGEYEGDVLNKIQIITQPTNTTAYTGGTYSFTVEATGQDLTYLWQQRAVSPVAGDWENTSHTTSTYTATTQSDVIGATWEYRCKVSNQYTEVYSEIATLTIVIPPNPMYLEITRGYPYSACNITFYGGAPFHGTLAMETQDSSGSWYTITQDSNSTKAITKGDKTVTLNIIISTGQYRAKLYMLDFSQTIYSNTVMMT